MHGRCIKPAKLQGSRVAMLQGYKRDAGCCERRRSPHTRPFLSFVFGKQTIRPTLAKPAEPPRDIRQSSTPRVWTSWRQEAHLGKYRRTLWKVHPIHQIQVQRGNQWVKL
jgi:hypothetical protein